MKYNYVFVLFFIFLSANVRAYELNLNEIQALQLLKQYSIFIANGNLKLLNTVQNCLEGNPKNTPEQIQFQKLTYSIIGKVTNQDYTCREALSSYFGLGPNGNAAFLKAFRQLQFEAILSQSGADSVFNAHNREFADADIRNQFTTYEHPGRSLSDRFFKEISHMPMPEAIVWDEAHRIYVKSVWQNCLDFYQSRRPDKWAITKDLKYSQDPNTFCGIVVNSKSNYESTRESLVFNSYLAFATAQRKIFRQIHLEKYYQILISHPHFLLLSTLTVSAEEAIRATRIMTKFQVNSLKHLETLDHEQMLDLVPTLHNSSQTLSSVLMNKYHYTQEQALEIFQKVEDQYKYREFKHSMMETAALLGATAACYILPIGRLKVLIKNMCLFGVSLPIDFIMLYSSIQNRNKNFEEFANTPEFEYVLSTPQKIEEEDLNIILTLVFIPLDIPWSGSFKLIKSMHK